MTNERYDRLDEDLFAWLKHLSGPGRALKARCQRLIVDPSTHRELELKCRKKHYRDYVARKRNTMQ
jgi:hypothetical protein